MKLLYHCAFPKNEEMLHVYVIDADTGYIVEMSDEIGGKPIVFPHYEATLYEAVNTAVALVEESAWLSEKEVSKLLKSAEYIWKV